jgi:aminoglycoside phosphotransferase (APT) family kinase protein
LEFLRHPGSAADELFMAQARGALTASLPVVRERFGSEFPTTLVTIMERLLANFDALMETRRGRFRETTTLVHGDYHPGQIFFASDRGGRFAIFDWQTVSAGSGGDDLARIIVSGLRAPQREAADGRLIDLYHSLLIEHGVTGYDGDRCLEDFRFGLLVSAVMNIIAVANIDPAQIEEYEASTGESLGEALLGRLAAALDAHNALDAVPG